MALTAVPMSTQSSIPGLSISATARRGGVFMSNPLSLSLNSIVPSLYHATPPNTHTVTRESHQSPGLHADAGRASCDAFDRHLHSRDVVRVSPARQEPVRGRQRKALSVFVRPCHGQFEIGLEHAVRSARVSRNAGLTLPLAWACRHAHEISLQMAKGVTVKASIPFTHTTLSTRGGLTKVYGLRCVVSAVWF